MVRESILSFSALPLRMATNCGCLIMQVGLFLVLRLIAEKIFVGCSPWENMPEPQGAAAHPRCARGPW